jgi:hypothetical protein
MPGCVSNVRERILTNDEDLNGVDVVGVVVVFLQDDAVPGAKDVVAPEPHADCGEC